MFNSLRGLTGGGGASKSEHPANVGFTFDDGDAIVNFENQLQPPPAVPTIAQQQEEEVFAAPQVALPPAAPPGRGGQQYMPNPPPAPQATEPEPYSGLETALKTLGHTLYSKETINAELAVQSGVNPGDPASQAAFRDFVVNVQQVQVYLAMLRGQSYVTRIHTPGVYYSIVQSTTTY
jgi:hypothetical protein